MARVEHKGKQWSRSFFAGRETRQVFRYVDKESGEQVKGVGSFVGRLLDVSSNGEVGQIALGWLENGDIEAIFPDMGAGRYVIAIDHVGQNGEVSRFLDGFAGYLEPGYVFKEISEEEETIVTVCCGDGVHEVWALAGQAVNYSAQDAIEAARAAAEAAAEVRKQLSACMAFMESFNKALSEVVYVENDYLYIAGKNTGHKVRGEDGITPHIGADGYWYIGEKRLTYSRGEDGITPHITSDGYWAFGSKKTTVRAEGRDGLDGIAMRRVLIKSTAELPAEEERGVYYYIKIGEKLYDVYVWVEGSGWTNVKETYDIATDRVHGLVKFTAGAVNEGGNVGWVPDSEGRPTGEARVPMSNKAEPGVGKLGMEATIDFGAPVGFNVNRAYYVPAATTTGYGSIKLGTATTLNPDECAMVGVNASGQAMVPAATLYSYGVVKLGTTSEANNPEPYRVGIGIGPNGELCNNYLRLGAIRHSKPSAWDMPWLNQLKEENPDWFTDTWYSGLQHSVQFDQTPNDGLVLKPVTETGEYCGGVFLAKSMDDTTSACVTPPALVMEYLNENYYTKGLLFTQQQTREYVSGLLKNYVSSSYLHDNYSTKEAVERALEKKMNAALYNSAIGWRNSGNFWILPESQRSVISSLEDNDIYLIYQD